MDDTTNLFLAKIAEFASEIQRLRANRARIDSKIEKLEAETKAVHTTAHVMGIDLPEPAPADLSSRS